MGKVNDQALDKAFRARSHRNADEHADAPKTAASPLALPAAAVRLQRLAGNSAVTSLLTSEAGEKAGGHRPAVQRKMTWEKTDWSAAKHLDASIGGGGGVLFVGEETLREVVVKPAEEMAPEGALLATLHKGVGAAGGGAGGWVSAAGFRLPAKDEATQIARYLKPLLGKAANADRAKTLIGRLTQPGLTVQELGKGAEMTDLLKMVKQHTVPGKKGGPGQLAGNSVLRIFTDPRSIHALGMNTAVDVFSGNHDRIFQFNPDNMMLTPYGITFIDNVWGGSPASSLRTITVAGRNEGELRTQTRDESMEYWKADSRTMMLAANNFDGLAAEAWRVAHEEAPRQAGVPWKEQPALSAALKPHEAMFKKQFALGLAEGKIRLIHALKALSGDAKQLTSIVGSDDVDEIRESIQDRLAFLMTGVAPVGGQKAKKKSGFPSMPSMPSMPKMSMPRMPSMPRFGRK